MFSTALAMLALVAGAMGEETHQVSCPTWQFACSDGAQCIPQYYKCDGDNDCRDASDEADETCPQLSCAATWQFACSDGAQCIPDDYKCDEKNDCRDASDEADETCPQQNCTSEEFTCANGKQCIPAERKCDGNWDCRDRSDEKLSICGFQCPGDSEYYDKSLQCDGSLQCQDGSDETRELCGFECADGSKTVHKLYKCDGELDCPDGSDEELCGRSCAFTFRKCAFISGHDDGGSFDFTNPWTAGPGIWDQCKDQCCRDEKCKSFDHRENEGPNCRLSYVTKDEVPNSFISTLNPEYNDCESGSWTYNEIATEEIVGEGEPCLEGTLKHCGPGLYCGLEEHCVPKWEF